MKLGRMIEGEVLGADFPLTLRVREGKITAPMRVLLAGFNVDTEILRKLADERKIELTPETLSAAYARISRSPLPVDELRKIAREQIARARKSNRTIIFEMGHHSVAEHAVFNFDIIGISRLAVEEVEKFRLGSYTEKSQRYVTLAGDFVTPFEIANSKLVNDFGLLARQQNDTYHYLYGKLRAGLLKQSRTRKPDRSKMTILENRAKEDARYVLSLATQAQLGATINGRNLELMLRRFASHPLEEVRRLGTALFDQVKRVAPSIIVFCEGNEYDRNRQADLAASGAAGTGDQSCPGTDEVSLVACTPDGDDVILAGLVHTVSDFSYKECRARLNKMPRAEKTRLVKAALKHMQLYDAPPREFEYATLTFELVVSASCFAQLKRHRMLTMTSQRYEPGLGVTVPEAIKRAGEEGRFTDLIEQTEHIHDLVKNHHEVAAQYVLTNAHRKRVLLALNLRELYHIARLREDQTAQWDIRGVVGKMVEKACKVMPVLCLLIGGKDRYPEIYKRLYGCLPTVVRAELPRVRKY